MGLGPYPFDFVLAVARWPTASMLTFNGVIGIVGALHNVLWLSGGFIPRCSGHPMRIVLDDAVWRDLSEYVDALTPVDISISILHCFGCNGFCQP